MKAIKLAYSLKEAYPSHQLESAQPGVSDRGAWTPAEPREPHQGGSSAWASGSLTPWPSASSLFTGLYQALGRIGSPAVSTIPCVRFSDLVRLAENKP